MQKRQKNAGIPVSPVLDYMISTDGKSPAGLPLKKRLLHISLLAIAVAVGISCIARVLVSLINLVTNAAFFGLFSVGFHSPADHQLGAWVIALPVIGGLLVGVMAVYGSKAIRGHGIPEAMEQILVNQSRIKPAIAILKPLSAAIAIGTGGPFGAEGPIIATGGAVGSTVGQFIKLTSNERKVLLAAGATAGMSAIFGTPIAAIYLAIELLLFEFSPKTILPVALACITGAAGHRFFFESGPVFPMADLVAPPNIGTASCSLIGIAMGVLAIVITRLVYWIEDSFEKLPIHWAWWPAIGGLAVGIVGYLQPHTLGVGYDNITSLLNSRFTWLAMLSLCGWKLVSWSIALGSGTSGGTLAPLLTIGGAAGALCGALMQRYFPGAGVGVPLGALIGMSSMFAGASRAYLTSIAFALESTMQSHALLPLLAACTASYLISFFFMENTIMTEKIARRGIYTPDSYEPDVLRKTTVSQVFQPASFVLSKDNTLKELRDYLRDHPVPDSHLLVLDAKQNYDGIISVSRIMNSENDPETSVSRVLERHFSYIKTNDSLVKAVEQLSQYQIDTLPVISADDEKIVLGLITYKDILSAYQLRLRQDRDTNANLSLKRQQIKILVHGRRLMRMGRD